MTRISHHNKFVIIQLIICFFSIFFMSRMSFSQNKFSGSHLTMAIAKNIDENGWLNTHEIEENQGKLIATEHLAFETVESIDVTKNSMSHTVPVHFVTEKYFDVLQYEFLEGGSFLKEGLSSHQVILSEEFAYEYFGSRDVLGLFVEIESIYYEVIGIVKNSEQTIDGAIYLPFNKEKITNVYYSSDIYNPVGNIEKMKTILGDSQDLVEINDIEVYQGAIQIQFLIAFILIALFIGLLCIKKIKENKMYGFLLFADIVLILFLAIEIYQGLWTSDSLFTIKSFLFELFNQKELGITFYLPSTIDDLVKQNQASILCFLVVIASIVNLLFAYFIGMEKERSDEIRIKRSK